MFKLNVLCMILALTLAWPALGQEEPLPSGPYDPQVEPEAPEGVAPEGVPTDVPSRDQAQGAQEATVVPEEAPPPAPEPNIIAAPAKEKPPYFVSGARVLPRTDSAVRLDLGFPDVRVAWHLPVGEAFEIAPAFGVAYGLHAENAGKMALLDFRCELKWNFYDKDELALALFADPGIQVPVWPQAGVGIVVGGPGMILDYKVADRLRLTPAIQIPWGLYFMGKKGDFAARFPFLLRLGLEYHVSSRVNLLFHMSGGGDVWTQEIVPGRKVAVLLRMVFGLSFRL